MITPIDELLAVIWLSRNMTDAILQTLRNPEEASWDALVDAETVIDRMPVSQWQDEVRRVIRRAKREG